MSDLSLPPLTLLPLEAELTAASPAAEEWADTQQGQDSGAVVPPSDTPLESPAAGHLPWPAPPLGAYAASPLPDEGLPCEVEGLNGRVMRVHLLKFDVEAGVIEVISPGLRAPMPLRYVQFRRLVLPALLQPLNPIASEAVQSYRLRSRNHTDRNGLTVGFVEAAKGVFLFEPQDNAGAVRRVFVPATAFESLNIGNKLLSGELPPPVKPPASLSAMGPLTEPAPLPATPGSGSPTGPASSPLPEIGRLNLDLAPAAAPVAVQATPNAMPAPGPATVLPKRVHAASEFLLGKPVTRTDELLAAMDRQASMPMLRMGEALIGLGLIDEKQLEYALVIQRGDRATPLGEILVRTGHIKRHDLEQALIRKMGYPVVDAQQFQPESDALAKVPYAMAARLQVLPLLLRSGRLVVAMEDPTRGKVLDELEFATACKVSPTLILSGQLGPALEEAYRRMGAEVQLARQHGLDGDNDVLDSAELLASLELEGADSRAAEDERGIEQSDNSLVRLINQMILEAQNQGVSDIHVETLPGKERVRIRFRRDGVLRPYMDLPHTYRQALIARIKIMCDLDISEKRKPQDGKITFNKFHPGSRLELRVATIPTAGGLEDAVMRLLASAKPLPIDEIGLSPRTLGLLKGIVERPYGMFLCVGPTGSGKTTTLHSALGYINRPDRKIWTAEDPVEITQPGLRQVQVNPKIDWTFAKALRAFLRADPDVIMVGEIRDEETANVAVESSLTGHLVLSTLHTNSAPETVTRLLDMGMDPFNFADALLGVLAQRLVRRICGQCRTSRDISATETDEILADYLHAFGHSEDKPSEDEVLNSWRQRFGLDGKLRHYQGTGCDKCGGSGLRGRAGIHELMPVSREVRRLIQTGGRAEELQKQAMAEGMLTLRQDGIEKVLQGLTSLAEVRSTSN